MMYLTVHPHTDEHLQNQQAIRGEIQSWLASLDAEVSPVIVLPVTSTLPLVLDKRRVTTTLFEGDGKRFVRLFVRAWRSIPRSVREDLWRYWGPDRAGYVSAPRIFLVAAFPTPLRDHAPKTHIWARKTDPEQTVLKIRDPA